MKKRLILLVIRVAKRYLYATPLHRSRALNAVYQRLFRVASSAGHVEVVSFLGHSFEVPSGDLTMLPSLLNGDYENYELELLRGLVRPGSVFADVGANIGVFSVIAGAAVAPGGHIYAFEPDPTNAGYLRRNLDLNGVSAVTCEQVAVGAERASATLHLERGSIGTHTVVAELKPGSESAVDVEMIDLDSYFRAEGRWPQIMKVDVEGYELRVFEGAQETLARAHQVLFEYFDEHIRTQQIDVGELMSFFVGFPHLYRVDGRGRRLVRLLPEDYSRLTYTNLLASKRPLDGE